MAEAQRKGRKPDSARRGASPHGAAVRYAAQEGRAHAGMKGPNWAIIAVLIAAAAIIGAILVVPLLVGSVPFSTFKSTFQSAPAVSIIATYVNVSQYANESPCVSKIIQVVAYTRKDSTMGVFFINSLNGTCTYQQSLGTANPQYASAPSCYAMAYARPSMSLNYSSTNGTTITASHMYVYGNGGYMAKCPVAVELS